MTQVVFVAISCQSPSSPPTAGCGLSSAAAVTGWAKGSPQFMRVSTTPPDLTDLYSSTSVSLLRARPVTHPTMCLEAPVISTVSGSTAADVSGSYPELIRFWLLLAAPLFPGCAKESHVFLSGGFSANP